MKVLVGNKLQKIREERKMSQNEFASLLSMSPSAYSRLERCETQAGFDDLLRFSEALDVPVQDLMPESITFHNHNNGRGAGVIFGNYIVNVNPTEHAKMVEAENEKLQLKIDSLQEKIALMEEQISLLRKQ